MREDELDRRLHLAAQRLRERAELQPVPPLPRRARAGIARFRLRPAVVQLVAVAASILVVAAVVFAGRLLASGNHPQPALAGSHPVAVAYGLGAVWVADNARDELIEVDPTGLTVRKRIPVGPDPVDVTVAGSSVWVLCRGDSSLRKYNPATGATDQVPASLNSIALGTDGISLLVLSVGNQTLEVHDAGDGHAVHSVVLGEALRLFAANKDSSVLAAGGDLVAALLTDKQPHRLATLPADATALALTDGGTALAATVDGRLSVVGADGQIQSAAILPGRPTALAVHDQTVWASTVDGSLVQLRLAGTALTTVHVNHPGTTVTELAVTGDGSVVGIATAPPFLIREREQP